MTFNDKQIKELSAPLMTTAVKRREQGGRQFSYIEGWHAIAEANRIFGFDAWSRETVDLRCVAEKERTIGQNKAPGWGVSYIAKVRVSVGGLVREGCGTGHGIDRDLGQAHESALKEAETDAMKRALMTFGNPFGLALYDKEQTNVAEPADESALLYVKWVEGQIESASSADELSAWWKADAQKEARRAHALEQDEVNRLKNLVIAKIEILKPKKAA